MKDSTKGYLYGAISAASYGTNPLFALPLYQDGMNTDSVLLFRYLLALPILAFMIHSRGQSFKVEKRAIIPLTALGLLMSASSLFLFLSYNYMEAGIASTLLFVYPIMVALIMTCFFKEKITMLTTSCITIALLGIGMLYQGNGNGTLSLTGVVCVMLSSLSYAVYMVCVNRSYMKNIPTVTLTFYVLLSGISLFGIRTATVTPLITPNSLFQWIDLVALATFPTCISFVCTTRAIQYIGSTPTAILGALEPVTAVFFGVIIFGEIITPRIACGMLLILVAVTMIIAGGNITGYITRFRKLFPKRHRKSNNS